MKKITFLSAEEEDTAKIVQAKYWYWRKGNFVDDKIKSRQTGDFLICKDEVEYMDIAQPDCGFKCFIPFLRPW